MTPLDASPPEILAVLRDGTDWCIISPAGRGRRFAHRAEAEEAALCLARETFETAPVEVLVQDHGGQLHLLSRLGVGWARPLF